MVAFPELVDLARGRVRQLRDRPAGAPAGRLTEDMLLAIGRLGVALEEDPALRARSELAALVDELQPAVKNACVVLDSYPSDLVLELSGVWEGSELERACWMRSALQFFIELVHETPAADELTGLPESLAELDEALRRWTDREGGAPPAEPGIPRSHRWWQFPEAG